MVNKILKCVGVLGEWDKVFSFWQSGMRCGAAMVVLSAALLGCSNTESLSPQTKTETQAEVPKLTAADEFTIKGKPTKTIETPWGPREIYDPTKDEEVLKAFQEVYSYGATSPFSYYVPKIGTGNIDASQYSTSAAKLIFTARRQFYFEWAMAGCPTVATSSCGTFYSADKSGQLNGKIEGSQNMCVYEGRKYYNPSYFPIGEKMLKSFNENPPDIDMQIANFFGGECLINKKEYDNAQ